MDEEKQVANTEVKETPPAEPTTPETTTQPTTDSQTVDKESGTNAEDRLDKHPRFQEMNQRMKDAEMRLKDYAIRDKETELEKLRPQPKAEPQDPYVGLDAETKAIREYEDLKSTVGSLKVQLKQRAEMDQQQNLNTQIVEAKDFSKQYGINFDEKLPEIVNFLSRPENKGRLTAVEAVRNLYWEQMTGSVKDKTTEELSKQKEELNAKKREANMQGSTVAPSAVIQSDEMARKNMTREEKMTADIKEAIALAKRGEKHPGVKSNIGDRLANY